MNDSTNLMEAAPPEQSTTLDAGKPSDPSLSAHKEPEEEKPQSRMDAIKRADADLSKDEPKEEAKPEAKVEEKAEEKPEAKEPAKAEAKEPVKEEDKQDRQERQDRRVVEAPKNFMPRAKDLWVNTPRAVQDEVDRIVREHEAERERSRVSTERYETIRPFDELAKSNGRDLTESLTKLNHIENMMVRNPIAGLNAILMEIGPTKPDGQRVSLYEVAHHIVQQGPQGYQQMMAQAQQQPQQQGDPRVANLEAQLSEMRQQQVHISIIEPFKRDHPRYDELQHDIAFFLESGKIPSSLSPWDKLAHAYDMAERINPASSPAPASDQTGLEPERRAESHSSGAKSIKGAPSSGMSPQTGRLGKMSRYDALDAAFSELGLSN